MSFTQTKPVKPYQRAIRRNFWLIKLRWWAIAGLAAIILLSFILSFRIEFIGILAVLTGLVIHNIISRWLLVRAIKTKKKGLVDYIERIIFYQIIIDLILLSVIIYLSGGLENPFILFYSFHVVLASILLTRTASYIVASFSVIMLGILAAIGYFNLAPHFSLGIFDYSSSNSIYSISVIAIFAIAAFVLVFLVSSISKRLKSQEISLIRINNQLEVANEELKRKDAVKDEYVSRVTHDIKGHLAAIQTNISVLQKEIAGPLSPQQEKFVNLAYNRTIRLTEFVKDLLRVTQMRLKNETDKQEFKFSELLEKVRENALTNAEKKNIELKILNSDNTSGFGNPFSIEEVILNLVLNAIKYTNENGIVTVTLSDKDLYTECSVCDTGIGIPPEEIEFVFDDFYRGSNAKNLRIEGTGMGLALVWQIIERNNGKIWVKSELGKGSCFTFSIPKKEEV
ncbi:MAG: HAMP domain-containing histidine kinase [Bacteroidales bacterium]|nr:HAMP domain-containing histidine kinase [Bacteroidales bacterium]